MPVGLQVLEAVRVNAIMQTLQDQRELPQQLKFLRRTAVVPALDGEIMARFTGRIQIADLVADDAKGVTYQTGKLSFETNTVPNIKHGTSLTQEQIQQLYNLTQGGGLSADQGLFTQFENRTLDGLRTGILQRMEMLIVAMQIDGFSYDRLGIRMLDVTWGMPADLKVTPSTPWTDIAATPVTDILTLKRLAQVRYGQVFDRLSMSLTAFLKMIATTEFQTMARAFIPPQLSYAQVPQQNTAFMKGLAQNVLEVAEIEINDERYWSQGEDGTLTSTPYQPINKVILSNRADDNNPEVMDFANGVVTESLVSAMMGGGGMIGSLGGPQRGPVAYTTANSDLNPPNVTYWGVARGFPRKKMLQATAVLTIGTLTDTIPVGEPF